MCIAEGGESITILLVLLIAVGGSTWLTKLRTTDWDRELWMAVYSINADGSPATTEYIKDLDEGSFDIIEEYMRHEIQRYGIQMPSPLLVKLRNEVSEKPPQPPATGKPLDAILWSLQLRYWAYRVVQTDNNIPADIKMFIIYHDPKITQRVPHSLGLEKGLIGVVHAFASYDMADENKVIITHEMLHTLGATDKYNPATNQPLYPEGFAHPNVSPLYPQDKAEIMGGRIPLARLRERYRTWGG